MSVTVWNAAQIEARVRLGAERGVMEGLGIVERRAIFLIMNPPKTGRVYHHRGVTHQASAPGEAPASDTGTLVNARRVEMDPQGDFFEVRGTLSFTSKHAEPLEKGTMKMEARPFARRALTETRDQVLDAIHRNIAAALRG
jgi:hypothetical protein